MLPTLLTLLLATAFGAADQYLGSLSAHPWGADVSGLSAPWLVLPFVVGCLQRTPRRAALMGLGCTFAALAGYCLMTLSPLENAHFSLAGVEAFVVGGNDRWLVAGAVTGPLFAWLGHRWRHRRAFWAGLVVAALICLEPLARTVYGNAIRSPRVQAAEIGVGIATAAALAIARAATPRRIAVARRG